MPGEEKMRFTPLENAPGLPRGAFLLITYEHGFYARASSLTGFTALFSEEILAVPDVGVDRNIALA